MKNVIWLKNISLTTRNNVGGKASSLSRLVSHGLPVPDGFSISVGCIDKHMAEIEEALGFNPFSLAAWDSLTDQQENESLKLIESFRWSLDKRNEFKNAVDQLGYPLAVRSSGVGEDGKKKSSAGIYESVLGIVSFSDFEIAVGNVLRSAFERPCRQYFDNRNLYIELPKLSIFVQKLIIPDVSGSCITQPSEDRSLEFVHIEMVHGHAEVIADGSVTPSAYTVDAFDLTEMQSKPSEPESRVDYIDGKRVVSPIKEDPINPSFKLKAQLVQLCKDCTEFFGIAQEIEWMLKDDLLFLVQSRPMTSDIRHILSNNWRVIIKREYGTQYASVSIDSLMDKGHSILDGLSIDQMYIPDQDGFLACIMRRTDWLAFSKFTQRFLTTDGAELLETAFYESAETYLKFCVDMRKLPLRKLSDGEILDLYEKHQTLAKKYCTFIWTCYVASNQAADALRFKLFPTIGKRHDFENVIQEALKPDQESEVARKFTAKLISTPTDGPEFEELLKNYAWEPCLDLHFRPLDALKLRSKIMEAKTIKSPIDETSVAYDNMLDQEQLDFIRIAKRLTTIRDQRDDYRRKCVWHIRETLFAEIASRGGCTVEELSFFTESEIQQLLIGNTIPQIVFTHAEIEDQATSCLVVKKSDLIQRITGSEIDTMLATIVLENGNINHPGLVIGQVAVPGQVSGVVKKVRGTHDLSRIQEGDILVAYTTHPDFVLAMRKAGAIVTDEGGQNSHAAQVAREFKIPCIIGTQTAMQHLTDGADVFVDADIGVVRETTKEIV